MAALRSRSTSKGHYRLTWGRPWPLQPTREKLAPLVTNVLSGLGPLGYPNFAAIGEGAIALLFDFDQSEFGFQLVGGDTGEAFISFFRRDGSLIDQVTVSGLAEDYYGFSRDGSIKDIAGISIYNNDSGGIALDNLKHDVAGVPGVPEPTSLALLGIGLAGLGFLRRRRT